MEKSLVIKLCSQLNKYIFQMCAGMAFGALAQALASVSIETSMYFQHWKNSYF